MPEKLTLEEAIRLAHKVVEWHTLHFSLYVSNGQLVHQGQLGDFRFEIGMRRVKWVQEYEEVIRPDCHYPFFNELVTVPKSKPSGLPLDGEWFNIKIVYETIISANYESQESSLEKLYTSITDKLINDKLIGYQSALSKAREIITR